LLTDRISTLPLTPPVTVEAGTPVGQVLDKVQENRVGCVLVYEAGRLAGILTERDILMKVVARDVDYASAKIDDFMTRNPATLSPDDSIGDAASLMTERHFRHIPIIGHDGAAVGVASIKDIIQLLAESFPEQVLNLPPRPHQKMETPEGG
jgi:CBS domain-containing protein